VRSMGGQPAPFLFKKTQGRQKGFASTPGKAAQRSTRAGGAKAREVTGLAVRSPKASPTARAAQPLRYGAFSVLPRTSHWPPIRTGRPKTQTAVSPNPADPEHCHPTALPPHSTATPAPPQPGRTGGVGARPAAPHHTARSSWEYAAGHGELRQPVRLRKTKALRKRARARPEEPPGSEAAPPSPAGQRPLGRAGWLAERRGPELLPERSRRGGRSRTVRRFRGRLPARPRAAHPTQTTTRPTQ